MGWRSGRRAHADHVLGERARHSADAAGDCRAVFRRDAAGLVAGAPAAPAPARSWDRRFMLLVLLAISAAILFNGANLPFHRDDTLGGIYQPAAQTIYQTGAVVPLTGADSLYRAYPILVPLSYAYAYFASGWKTNISQRPSPRCSASPACRRHTCSASACATSVPAGWRRWCWR
ncbi:MAG: hypothetical protein U0521_01505 [Anaerolineae bacterium]